MPSSLADATIGRTMLVTKVAGERAFRRRLLELGLVPGTPVVVRKVAPMGDPLELSTRGCTLSIRRSEAQQIFVAPRATAPSAS